MKKDKISWFKYIKQSAIEALFAVLLFFLLYTMYNIEKVRSLAGDSSFSLLDSIVFSNIDTIDGNQTTGTPIRVYNIDEKYFREKGLIDEYNDTNYGNLFPRSKLAEFVKHMDNLPENKQPRSFFINYSFVDGSASYDIDDTIQHISYDDKIFLKQLAQERKYIILLPKNQKKQFVQIYAKKAKIHIAKIIANKIKEGKIIFVGTDFLKSDHKIYRYNPMISYDKNETIYNIALVQWQLAHNKEINKTEIENEFNTTIFLNKDMVTHKGRAVLKSNILYKNLKHQTLDSDKYIHSYWDNLQYASAIEMLKDSTAYTNETMVMLGEDFRDRDKYDTSTDANTPSIRIHANATKTVLFLDGRLKRINPFIGFLIVFIVFFSITLLSRVILPKIPEKVKIYVEFFILLLIVAFVSGGVYVVYGIWIMLLLLILFGLILGAVYYYGWAPKLFDFFFELVLLTGFMLFMSSYILTEWKLWFNWFIPVIVYYMGDSVSAWREYQGILKTKEKSV